MVLWGFINVFRWTRFWSVSCPQIKPFHIFPLFVFKIVFDIITAYTPRGESIDKLPLRNCPGCSVPEPYRSSDWALVPAKPAQGLNTHYYYYYTPRSAPKSFTLPGCTTILCMHFSYLPHLPPSNPIALTTWHDEYRLLSLSLCIFSNQPLSLML
jgi:hypothetical protein